MRMEFIRAVLFTAVAASSSFALAQDQAEFQTQEYRDLVAALPTAQHTLQEGIAQVATGAAIPNESKYEMDDGKLMLSVYTSQKGLGVVAEENVFDEYKGDATQAEWTPEQEVFEDFQHIARSAQYHTLLSMTELTIPHIIEKASAGGATVISVKEKVIDGKPVFEVVTAEGSAAKATYHDIVTGEPTGG